MRWVQLRASTEQVECSPYYSTFHVSLLTTSLTTFTYSHIMSLTHSCLLCHLILPHISYHLPLTKISLISHKHFKQFIIFLFVTLATIYAFIHIFLVASVTNSSKQMASLPLMDYYDEVSYYSLL